MKQKITVVGAGFSGLTLAHELVKRNFTVEVYEKSARAGGLLGTRQTPLGPTESAANGLLLNSAVRRLLDELGLEALSPRPQAKKRFIWRGRPRRWPLNFLESLSLALHGLFHLLTRKRSLLAQPGESVRHWGRRTLGRGATEYFVAPALQGIYAGDISKMSASLIFNPLFQRTHRDSFGGTVSFRGGMQELIDRLRSSLEKRGVIFHFGREFAWADAKSPVVLATSAAAAAELLATRAPETSALLQRILLSPIISVTTFWSRSSSRYRGFGCLIPRGKGFRSLGVLMNSQIFENRGEHSETYILGGATDPEVVSLSDEEIRDLLLKERRRLFGVEAELRDFFVTRWPRALPQYNVELEGLLKELRPPTSVFLHGNYLGSIGLSKILDRSGQLAEELANTYG